MRSRISRGFLRLRHSKKGPLCDPKPILRRDSPYSERTAIYIQIDKISFPFACSPCYASSISRRFLRLRHSKKGPPFDPKPILRRDSPYSERTVILSSTDKIASPFACSPCYASSISRWRTPSEGSALQRTDSNLYSDRQDLVSVRVQPVLCARAYHGGARPPPPP